MIFSSIFFLFIFLPVTMILYYLVPWKLKNLMLLLCSLVFYAWGEPVYVFLMLFSITFNYFSGIEIDYYRRNGFEKKQKICFIVTVVVNVAILGYFKYYGFLIDSINAILPIDIPYRQLSLPIGISFYTFQTLSYIIDLYKGIAKVQKDYISFGTYVTMFPQLIAGPIVRYQDIDRQLKRRTLSMYKFGQGLTLFIRGLGKKVLLANNIGIMFDAIYAMDERSVLCAWLGTIAYTMQIYFDFCGYSDMAVGLGKMFGFEFVSNFNYPYVSKSLTEFWRRWHISLGTWFREYIYIPLGGNRVSEIKKIRNILVVWMLTGLWHGAAWNFVFWGLFNGLILLLEKKLLLKYLEKIPGVFAVLYNFILLQFSWTLFFSSSLSEMISYIGNMFGIGANGFIDGTAVYYLTTNLVLLLLCFLASGPYAWKLLQINVLQSDGKIRSYIMTGFYVVVFVCSVAYLVNATYNPFLYFRF